MAEIASITKSFPVDGNGIYSEVIRTTYDDGSYTEQSHPVGPADALTNDQADKILAKAAELASVTYAAANARRVINEANDDAATIATITATDPLKVIQDRYQAELLAPGWEIGEGAGFVPLVFTVNAQGNLRYSVNGAATKGATFYGAVIRLNNYPASPTNTEFFISENGNRYFSLPNKGVIIKTP